MVRPHLFIALLFAYKVISQSIPLQWSYVGPKSNSYQFKGLFTALWVDENDLNNVMAGSHTSGLFSTQNALTSEPKWENITDNLPYMNFGISGIVVKKNTENKEIYISTYTGGGLLTKNFGNGILHTVNGGKTWEHIGPGESSDHNFPLQGLIANPDKQDQMASFDRKDLYLTNDSWKTFSKVKLPFHTDVDNVEITEIEYGPNDPGTIYACTRTYLKNKAQIFVTKDNGNTWADITPPDIACERIAISTLKALKFKGKFYVTSGNTGIYIHYYNGKEFSKALNTQPIGHLAASSFWCLEMKVNQADTSVIYVGMTEVSMSIDGGKNFTKIAYYNGANTHADVRDMVLLKDSRSGRSDKLFLANDGGISLSNDVFGNGVKFKNLNGIGLDGNLFWGIDVLQSDSLFIAGGAQDNGGFFIRNNWETNNLASCGDGYYGLVLNDSLAFNLGNPPIMLLHNSNRNSNGYISIPDGAYEARRPLILLDSTVYIGHHNIWSAKVKDIVLGNYTFKKIGDMPEVKNGNEIKNREIKAMCITKYNTALIGYANVLYGGPENTGKLFFCANIKAKDPVFTDVTSLNFMKGYEICRWWYIESVVGDPSDKNTFYMIYKDPFDQKNSFLTRFIYYPDSNKAEVTPITFNLKKAGFNKLKMDDHFGILYLASNDGVYSLNTAFGDTVWKSLEFFPKVIVSDIALNYQTNSIYVATFGRGIWTSYIPSYGGFGLKVNRSFTVKGGLLKIDGLCNMRRKKRMTITSKLVLTKNAIITMDKGSVLVLPSKNNIRNEKNEVVEIERFVKKHNTAQIIYLNK